VIKSLFKYVIVLQKIIISELETATIAERLMRVPRVREIWYSNPGQAKSYTAMQTVRHRFNIYARSCVGSALWRGDRHCKLVIRFGVIRRV